MLRLWAWKRVHPVKHADSVSTVQLRMSHADCVSLSCGFEATGLTLLPRLFLCLQGVEPSYGRDDRVGRATIAGLRFGH